MPEFRPRFRPGSDQVDDAREGKQIIGGREIGGNAKPGQSIDPAEAARRVRAQIAQMEGAAVKPETNQPTKPADLPPAVRRIQAQIAQMNESRETGAAVAAQRAKMGLGLEKPK